MTTDRLDVARALLASGAIAAETPLEMGVLRDCAECWAPCIKLARLVRYSNVLR